MPIIPLIPIIILLGLLALPNIVGCDRIKEELAQDDCDPGDVPDEYRTFHNLWPEMMENKIRAPWFERWMKTTEPVPLLMRNEISAFDSLFDTACKAAAKDAASELKSTIVNEYRAATAESFASYLNGAKNPQDNGLLVLLGMLAPLGGGDGLIIGAMNALNLPIEAKGPAREQRSDLGQLIKAAFYYNAAAKRADPSARFCMEHKKLRLAHADAAYVKSCLKMTKERLGEVHVNDLTQRQRAFYDTLAQAADNLKKSIAAK